MAESVNQAIADALLERQLRIGRVETDLRRQVWERLAILEAEILAVIKANDPTEFALLSRRRREVEALMADEVDPLITLAYARLARMIDAALVQVAEQEAAAVQEIINEEAEEELIGALPSTGQLRRVVTETPIPTPSKPTDVAMAGADWWQRQGGSVSERIGGQLLVAVALEESLTQMTRRIRGTPDQGFQDGILAKAREDAARLLRTQMTNALTEARMLAAGQNPAHRLVAIHQSILDSRTSTICLSRHGLQYTIPEHTPINHSIPYLTGPPYHVSCRSSMVVGVRGGGPIMEANLNAWLRRKGITFQNELLGPTRAQLWREGKLTVRQLIDSVTGKPLNLEELGV